MNTTVLIIVIVVAVIIVVAIVSMASVQARRKRSERLRERFGPEYDRTVDRADDRRSAEAELREREKRHQKLELRSLDSQQRHDFRERWTRVQNEFVDDPGQAINDADRLVTEVMAARGYPTDDDFEQRAGDLSVEHPTVTQRYREARRISHAHEHGGARTEDLRNAVTSYRSLVDALLDEKTADDSGKTAADSGKTAGDGGKTAGDDRTTAGDDRTTAGDDRTTAGSRGERQAEENRVENRADRS